MDSKLDPQPHFVCHFRNQQIVEFYSFVTLSAYRKKAASKSGRKVKPVSLSGRFSEDKNEQKKWGEKPAGQKPPENRETHRHIKKGAVAMIWAFVTADSIFCVADYLACSLAQ